MENSSKTRGSKRKEPENSEKSGYRLNAKGLFLTYSQCNVEPSKALELLKVILKNFEILEYIIAQELHQDGNKHLHAYLKLNKPTNFKLPTCLDLKVENEVFHGKYEPARSQEKVLCYCAKEGNYISTYSREYIEELITKHLTGGEIHLRARKQAESGNLKKALETLEHKKTARDMNLHGASIKSNLEALLPKAEEPRRSLEEFDCDLIWEEGKALILWGPTNTGKTSYACALLPKALFVRHKDDLRNYDTNKYNGIIFDDMTFAHWPEGSQIHLVDWEKPSSIDCRYTCAKIPAFTRKIFTYNLSPENVLKVNNPAIARRVQTFYVEKSLVRTTPVVPVQTSLTSNNVSNVIESEDEEINRLVSSDNERVSDDEEIPFNEELNRNFEFDQSYKQFRISRNLGEKFRKFRNPEIAGGFLDEN